MSLDAFMSSQGFPGSKLAFPHDSFTVDMLKETTFPPIEAFKSTMSGKELTAERYAELKEVFDTQCDTMADYLRLYACADVKDLVPAIEKHMRFYVDEDVCVLTEAISAPAAAVRIWGNSLDQNEHFYLPMTAEHRDLYRTGIIGGKTK